MRTIRKIVGAMSFGLALLVLAQALPISAQAQTVVEIADDAALRVALAGGVAGDTLVLAPGRYSALELRGDRGTAPAVIRSADPADPAEIAALRVTRFDGLRLENLYLRYRFTPSDVPHYSPFEFRDCDGLAIVSTRIEGDEAHGVGPPAEGLPYAFGLSITGCEDVRLESLHISRFLRGIVIRDVQGIDVVGNELTALRSDGINFAQVEDVLIQENHIHSFRRTQDLIDHSDMIQFWTNGTEEPSRRIVIRNNLLHSGPGMFTQSIFMRNEVVDLGHAGREMFYNDVLIEENVIINAHLHGITVGESLDLTIRHNTLAFNPLSAGDDSTRPLWRPAIRVAPRSVEVRIDGNLAIDIVGYDGQPGWRIGHNLLIQDQHLLQPGFYGRVFSGMPGGDPLDLANFRYRPDGEAADPALGAARLRQ